MAGLVHLYKSPITPSCPKEKVPKQILLLDSQERNKRLFCKPFLRFNIYSVNKSIKLTKFNINGSHRLHG